MLHYFGGFPTWGSHVSFQPDWVDSPLGYIFLAVLGVVILTALMHLARAIGRVHARMAKVLLVTQGA
jgi:hypothetical protein